MGQNGAGGLVSGFHALDYIIVGLTLLAASGKRERARWIILKNIYYIILYINVTLTMSDNKGLCGTLLGNLATRAKPKVAPWGPRAKWLVGYKFRRVQTHSHPITYAIKGARGLGIKYAYLSLL